MMISIVPKLYKKKMPVQKYIFKYVQFVLTKYVF